MKIKSTLAATIRMEVFLEETDKDIPESIKYSRSITYKPARLIIKYRYKGWSPKPEVEVLGQRIKKNGELGQVVSDTVYGDLPDWIADIARRFHPDWDSIVRWDDGDGG